MTEQIRMKGTISWAKVYEPDTAFGAEKFKIDFYPETEADWKVFKDSGIQKKVKENEQGKFFQLDRPAFKLIQGKIVNFTGPIIEDKDGKVIVDYVNSEGKRIYSYEGKEKPTRRGSPILIGNGSKVEVTVSVYDTFKGKGQRLDKVKVLDLIEFKREAQPAPELSPLVTNKELKQEEDNSDLDVFVETSKGKAPW